MRKIIITLSFLVIGIASSFAQHEIGPALSSQIFSRINYNPAGMGNSPDINIFSQSRMQWVGFDGAPTSTVFNIHYFNELFRSGLGGVVSYDEIGHGNKAINAKLSYAYMFDLTENSLLSLGLSAGVNQFSKDFSEDVYSGSTDDLTNESYLNADFDFGVEYATKWVILGASVNHIGQMDAPTTLSPTQTYFAYARGNVELNKDIMLVPSVLYMNSGQSSVLDFSAVAFFKQYFWGGFSYRTSAALTTLIGMEWKFLRVGYGYELSTGETANISSNTHELMLSFIIKAKTEEPQGKKKKRRR